VEVGDDKLQALDRPRCHTRDDPLADHDRAPRTGRSQLDDAIVVIDRRVVVDLEAELVGVESLGAIQVTDRHDHHFEGPVHDVHSLSGCSEINGHWAAPTTGWPSTSSSRRGRHLTAPVAPLNGTPNRRGSGAGAPGGQVSASRTSRPAASAARARLAHIMAIRGEIEAAREVMAPVQRLLDSTEGETFVPGIGHAMGVLLMQAGNPDVAIAWLERDACSTDRGVETYLAAQALPELGAAMIAVGRRDEAAAVLDRAVAVATRLGMPGAEGAALEARAELAAHDPGTVGPALDLAHAALRVHADHGLRASVVRNLESLARHAAAVKATADDVRILAASETARESMGIQRAPHRQTGFERAIDGLARTLGSDAFDAAWTEGARLTLADATAYASRARGARGRPATGWHSLTPTEHEVVRLVVEGHPNPLIAARLFMSRNTVKTHLKHIFAKLGVANRTELATLAARWQ
jgi:DNA-binding CsgD family transcriptional regulator